ncbi:hypothetical protein LZ31DRAFT_352458 [Colletotrichum somersetense]|nr:hypothetical protein LZ31DRAFT_352458 [Colletotrichum somersetense]
MVCFWRRGEPSCRDVTHPRIMMGPTQAHVADPGRPLLYPTALRPRRLLLLLLLLLLRQLATIQSNYCSLIRLDTL